MTVYDRIKSMSKSELTTLIQSIYLWGHINEQCATDDEMFYLHFMNMPSTKIDDVIKSLENLTLYRVTVTTLDGSHSTKMATKFYSILDATDWLIRQHHVEIVNSTTLANAKFVFRIEPDV